MVNQDKRSGLWFDFSMVVLVWGTTWYAIKLQTNGTDAVFSVVLRFALAAIFMFAYLLLKREPIKISRRDLPSLLAVGAFFFSANYILVYKGTEHLTSGLVALLFSTTVIFNLFNETVFLRKAVGWQKTIAAILGIVGLGLVFQREIVAQNLGEELLVGSALVIAAAAVVAVGNLLAAKVLAKRLPVATLNAWGMLLGTGLSFIYLMVTNPHFTVNVTPSYIGSLLYLAIIGSVLAFALYMRVVQIAGPSSASYTSVMFPLVALLVSTFVEDFHWSAMNLAGVLLLTTGNVMILNLKAEG